MLLSSIRSFGRYCLFLTQVFRWPDKWGVTLKNTVFEISKLGVDSIPLVIIISIFIGADDPQYCLAADTIIFHRPCHARDIAAGVLLLHFVADTCRQGGQQHSL